MHPLCCSERGVSVPSQPNRSPGSLSKRWRGKLSEHPHSHIPSARSPALLRECCISSLKGNVHLCTWELGHPHPRCLVATSHRCRQSLLSSPSLQSSLLRFISHDGKHSSWGATVLVCGSTNLPDHLLLQSTSRGENAPWYHPHQP